MSPGWCLACPRGCGGPACELCKCENCQRGCYLSLWKSGPLLFQKQASDVGWGEGIPLQEVEVLGGGGLAGRGWEPPPPTPPTRGLLVSVLCLPGKAAGPACAGGKMGLLGWWWGEGCGALRPTWEFF